MGRREESLRAREAEGLVEEKAVVRSRLGVREAAR